MKRKIFEGISLTLASVFAFGLCVPLGTANEETVSAAVASTSRVWETARPFDQNDWWTRNEDGSITAHGINGDPSMNMFVTKDYDAVGNYTVSAYFKTQDNVAAEKDVILSVVPAFIDDNNYMQINLYWRPFANSGNALSNVTVQGRQNGEFIHMWNGSDFVAAEFTDQWVYNNGNESMFPLYQPVNYADGWTVSVTKRVAHPDWHPFANIRGDWFEVYVNGIWAGLFCTDLLASRRDEAFKVGVGSTNTQVTVSDFTVSDSDWSWDATYPYGDYNYNAVAGSDMVATGSGWSFENGKITANTIPVEPRAESPYDALRRVPTADYSVTADVNITAKRENVKNEAGLTVWEKDYANNLKANLVYENGAYTAAIYGSVGGVTVASESKALSLTGNEANLYVEKIGSTVTLYVDGEQAYTYSNQALASSEFAGVNARNATAEFTGFAIGYPTALSMKTGASVRIAAAKTSGIKFQTNLDRATVDAVIAAKGANNVSFGTLIVPKDYLTDGVTPTFASLNKAGKKVLDVPSTGFLTATETEYTYWGSIVDILEANYKREFVGIGYMKVVEADGTVSYTYADYLASNARSVYTIASDALGDVNPTQEGKYQFAVEGGYSPYDETARGILSAYVA
ncbi:MAG: hypothetical protein IJY62_03315 [Clostridia bacterium]|nr:hypothetical protein [Clostridia bacterium]